MNPRILLVNAPIYDFFAYDFWLKLYGMLRGAGFLRQQADFQLFDFLDPKKARRFASLANGNFFLAR
jgi:hypothetical protein